jgi:hypothetical protein
MGRRICGRVIGHAARYEVRFSGYRPARMVLRKCAPVQRIVTRFEERIETARPSRKEALRGFPLVLLMRSRLPLQFAEALAEIDSGPAW